MQVSLEISDLTASFSAHGTGAPATLWCSPTGATLACAPIEVNPDLYTVTLAAAGNKLSVGTIKKLTKDLQHYRDPLGHHLHRCAVGPGIPASPLDGCDSCVL